MEEIEYKIGEIDFSNIIQESTNLNLPSIGKCSVYVRGNEGPIPHFHLISNSKSRVKGNKGNFESCICIYQPLYFNHGGYQDKLTRKEAILLNNWMKEKVNTKEENLKNVSNWGFICTLWAFSGNPLINVPKNPVQPVYSDLQNMRG